MGRLISWLNESHCTEGERQSLGNMNIAIKATEQKQVDIIYTDESNQLVEFFYPMKIAYYSTRGDCWILGWIAKE